MPRCVALLFRATPTRGDMAMLSDTGKAFDEPGAESVEHPCQGQRRPGSARSTTPYVLAEGAGTTRA